MSTFTPPVLYDRPWYDETAEAEGRPWEKGLFKYMHMDNTNRLKPRYVGVFAISDGTFRQSDPAGGFTNTDVPYPWDPNNPSAPYQTTYFYDLSQTPPTLQVSTVSHTVWVVAYFDRPTKVSSAMAANLTTAGYGSYLS